MRSWGLAPFVLVASLSVSCGQHAAAPGKLTVAAAANLTDVFAEVSRAFQAKSKTEVVFSYGSTAQLSQQIENGAPFDLFAAADTEHVDALVASRKLIGDSRAVYARGQLAFWAPRGQETGIRELKDLAQKKVRFISVAQPELAPYGKATIQTLKNSGLWETLQPKLVYGNSISMAKQMASSGNADVAFTAYSLLLHDQGTVEKVDPSLYHPIEQALGIVAASTRIEDARQFRAFLLGDGGQAIFAKNGYLMPAGTR